MSEKVKIVATGARVPYPGLPPIVGRGKQARRAPHRYVTKDEPAEVSLSADHAYWGRRLVKKEVALVEGKDKHKAPTKEIDLTRSVRKSTKAKDK